MHNDKSAIGVFGCIFIGTTLILAAFDGALLGLLIATGFGLATYSIFCKLFKKSSEAIFKREKRKLENIVFTEPDDKKRRQLEQDLKHDLKKLEEKKNIDEWGRKHAAKLVSLGAFAWPVAGVATVVGAVMALSKVNKTKTIK